MFRCVVVPLDGSAFAEQAVQPAAWIAQRSGGQLILLHVCVPANHFAGTVDVETEEAKTAARHRLTKYMGDLANRVSGSIRLPVSFRVAEGNAVTGIVDAAADLRADLVVMTSHGLGELADAWIGSVADGVLRQSQVPVLLVRPRTNGADREPRYQRILVPLDGSPTSEQALAPAIKLAKLANGAITLMAVVRLQPPMGEPEPLVAGADTAAAEFRCAEAYIAEVTARVNKEVRADGIVRVSLHPAMAILAVASELNADAITMATHGRSRLQRMTIGSVSDKVLRASSTPVLVVRPEPEDENPVA